MLVSAIPICGNNQGSIFNGLNPAQELCMKHIDIHYHFVHEGNPAQELHMKHIDICYHFVCEAIEIFIL